MKKSIIISIFVLVIMIVTSNVCYAAVEIIPSKTGDGKDAIVNTTVSNSYLLCQGMKDFGGSLYGTTVKPHLATNKDWGAVSYLSNSIYGTNTQGQNTGVTVNINGVNYYSTTTNITGVMNWGSNPNKELITQSAGLYKNYTSGNDNVTELYNNRETPYIEYIIAKNAANTKGMAMQETSGTLGGIFYPDGNASYPSSLRRGLFGGNFSSNGSAYYTSGAAYNFVTFRPVVWN